MSMMMMNAIILWQVYEISGSALNLALVGITRLVPTVSISLIGGAFADSHNRRVIVMGAQLVAMAASATLLFTTAQGVINLPIIYAVVFCLSAASSFENPARQALVPQVVTAQAFPGAIVVNSTVQSLGFVTGGALGGLILGEISIEAAYGTHIALLSGSLVLLALLRPRPFDGPKRAFSLESIKEGVAFVAKRQVLIGAMALDMFAVIFGGAQALLPIYAKDILEVGGRGYGLLLSSLNAGALLMAIALMFLPQIHRAGRALLTTIAIFGILTILFGISRNFYLSLAIYTSIGMADQVSVVLRQSVIQLATPDELRGRVSSVSQIFIGASNQLSAAGFVASLTTATFAVVSGGLGTVAVVGIVARRLPELRRYRIEPQRPEVVVEPQPDRVTPAAG
jgi:MFS family permease